MRKLTKSSSQKMLAGVCGGIAEYFGWDVTLVRIGWAILSLFFGTGIFIYIILAVLMPANTSWE
ncbi:PspC domain-containing protein [Listeria sp. FSL L7-1582]|uniref:PspC domain-containing protein n=1 Tax=Listeria portnoyi TaxID=2713504 RepID=UPI00164ED53D|nr:PspC domain-containing protein [Listeria portnoyi]MBC6309082.1 PspC domain-containing protein [Listeria portnoyi]